MSWGLAQLIREARLAKEWSQADLATHMGVSRGYIGQLETGKIGLPRQQQREQLERLLGISQEQMLRAAGQLSPTESIDIMAELRRIRAMANPDDRVRALKALPPEVVQSIEDLAVDAVRQSVQSRTE